MKDANPNRRFRTDATRVIVADTLKSMLETCERLDKYKKEFSEMLLEEGALGRTAQQNQDEKQARAAVSPSSPFPLATSGTPCVLLAPPLPLQLCAQRATAF